jgi:hypothetical protein
MVDAGEDIRWVLRRRVSSVCIPGNDFYLLDNELVVFLHYSGAGLNTAFTMSTDSKDVELCRTAFDAVWALAIPHGEYDPIWRSEEGAGSARATATGTAQECRSDEGGSGPLCLIWTPCLVGCVAADEWVCEGSNQCDRICEVGRVTDGGCALAP